MKPQSLSDFHGECRSSGNQLVYNCPECDGKFKLYINPDTGLYCCFKCGLKGKVEMGGAADVNEAGREIMGLMVGQPGYTQGEVELPPFHALSPRAERYMMRRGITLETVKKLGIVEWEDKYRILFPYWDDQGQLVYWNGRSFSDQLAQGPKYIAAPGKHPLYVLEPETPCFMEAPTVIVEGVFDAIAVHLAAPNLRAVALGGKSLPRYLRPALTKAVGRGSIRIGLDPDALAAAFTLHTQIGGEIIDLPDDPADMWVKDPDGLRRLLA